MDMAKGMAPMAAFGFAPGGGIMVELQTQTVLSLPASPVSSSREAPASPGALLFLILISSQLGKALAPLAHILTILILPAWPGCQQTQ
jgi:hypothetical protein